MDTNYESEVALIKHLDKSIFHLRIKNSNKKYDLEEAKKQSHYMGRESINKSIKLIVDTRGSLLVPSDEALSYFSKKNRADSKYAIVIDNLPMKLMFQYTIKQNIRNNIQIFKTFVEAKQWLLK